MYKMRIVLASLALLSAQHIFAETSQNASSDSDMTPKPCLSIVKACKKAGFTRHGQEGKRFWKDCMKPLILGQTVTGVTLDAQVGQACRAAKVEELKAKLQELQAQ